MWLYIPQEFCPSPPDTEVLNSESSSCFPVPELFVTSSGKGMLRPISWLGFKTRPWVKLLFGMTLEPSTADLGVQKWIGSLGDIPANRFQLQVRKKAPTIRDTCGQLSLGLFRTSNQPSVSSRTFPTISDSDSVKSPVTFGEWATKLRQHSLQRKRSVLPIVENGCSSSRQGWPTPTCQDEKHSPENALTRQYQGRQIQLVHAAGIWPTITVHGNYNRKGLSKNSGDGLVTAVNSWPTPCASDYKGPCSSGSKRASEMLPTAAVWPTPKAMTGGPNSKRKDRGSGGPDLQESVKNWATPTSPNGGNNSRSGKRKDELLLGGQVKNWATPTSSMDGTTFAGERPKSDLINQTGQVSSSHRDEITKQGGPNFSPNDQTSYRRLNPKFVNHLMGIPIGLTNFASTVTGLSHYKQRMRWQLYCLISEFEKWNEND